MAVEDVLGINQRNIDYIMTLNPREYFSYVDDKIITKSRLREHGLPFSPVLGMTDSFFGIEPFLSKLRELGRFALKPARGSGGNGIVIVKECLRDRWILAGGQEWGPDQQREHVENILYGTYSLDSTMDSAFAEALIDSHADLLPFSRAGLPDIRVILHLGAPVLSMLRVPTSESGGKANLHAGGFAVGIDLATGLTRDGWHRGKRVETHPENGIPLRNHRIPFWPEILDISGNLFELFPLGYMGADFALDQNRGPQILELNARPGLEIQNVTGRGLRPLLIRGPA